MYSSSSNGRRRAWTGRETSSCCPRTAVTGSGGRVRPRGHIVWCSVQVGALAWPGREEGGSHTARATRPAAAFDDRSRWQARAAASWTCRSCWRRGGVSRSPPARARGRAAPPLTHAPGRTREGDAAAVLLYVNRRRLKPTLKVCCNTLLSVYAHLTERIVPATWIQPLSEMRLDIDRRFQKCVESRF